MKEIVFIILIYLIPLVILIGIGIGVFFTSRRFLRKRVTRVSSRKLLTWLPTVLLTPLLFVGFAWVVIFIWTYYPNRDYTQKAWRINPDKRYEYSASIIKSKILIGKSKSQVGEIFGEGEYNAGPDTWKYDLGDEPDILAFSEPFLFIYFENGKVVRVEKHYNN